MLDLSAVPNVKGQSHLPIIVDPSHATGRPDLIPAMAGPASPPGPTASTSRSTTARRRRSPTARRRCLPHQFLDLMDDLRRLASAGSRVLAPPEK